MRSAPELSAEILHPGNLKYKMLLKLYQYLGRARLLQIECTLCTGRRKFYSSCSCVVDEIKFERAVPLQIMTDLEMQQY